MQGETKVQRECSYCHVEVTKDSRMYGRNISNTGYIGYETVSRSDYNKDGNFVTEIVRTTVKRVEKVVSKIISPESMHPRLRTSIQRDTDDANFIDMPIHYCPMCGRKLEGTE